MTRLSTGGFGILAVFVAATFAFGQEAATPPASDPAVELLNSYAPATSREPLSQVLAAGNVKLAAQLTSEGGEIGRGLAWSIFKPQPGPDGKLPLVAAAQGGSAVFELEPGSYLVHAAFGRAGATKRITVGRESKQENIVLDAGGLKLNAVLAGGKRARSNLLDFEIREAKADGHGEHPLIVPDVRPDTVVRLNSGTYQILSKYGSDNAITRSDIKVEAGKLVEATIEHHAAELTLKLVRERGGEAIADTSWSILSNSGDPVRDREIVGAYASMVLAEGDYTIIAKNRDRLYQKALTIESGRNQEVEVVTSEDGADQTDEAD